MMDKIMGRPKKSEFLNTKYQNNIVCVWKDTWNTVACTEQYHKIKIKDSLRTRIFVHSIWLHAL